MYFVAKPNEEAKSFIQAAGLTDETQMKAIGTLVFDLKNYNIWDKMKAIYPMVGQAGVSSSFQFNLKNPSLFKGTFSGSWIFSSTGATPDGTSAYMNTGLKQSNLLQNSQHLSVYSRTNNTSGIKIDIGMYSDITDAGTYLGCFVNGNLYTTLQSKETNAGTTPYTTSLGLMLGQRVNSADVKYYQNSTFLATYNNTSKITDSIYNIYIGAVNIYSTPLLFSNREIAFSTIGDGLTDTEAANFYTAVQRFQTTLGRQV